VCTGDRLRVTMRQGALYCNRTATRLVQANTQRTIVLDTTVENPINKPNYRTQ
jgi:hypothetical protein